MFELEFDSNARLLNLNNVGGVTGKGAVPSLYHNNVAVIQILATGDIVSAVSQITIRAIFSDRRSGEDTGSVRGNRVVDGDGHSSVLCQLSRQRQRPRPLTLGQSIRSLLQVRLGWFSWVRSQRIE